MLRFLTAGESHGQALVVVVDGLPAGLTVDVAAIDRELARRQGGYGRGQRMRIEEDRAEVLSGVRHGETLGSPVSLLVRNRDWPNWQRTMPVGREASADAGGALRPPVTRPRPGHADLAGGLKYGRTDLRDVLERASARETAARVAAGSVARQLLAACGVRVASHVTRVAGAVLDPSRVVTIADIDALPPSSPLRCVDAAVEARMVEEIDRARAAGDTVGGAFEVIAEHVPPGLGTYAQWDRRLDGQLAQAVMSIPAIKAVGIGLGARAAELPGSQVHDAIVLAPPQAEFPLARPTNRAGGLEGGVTNGEPLRVTAAMKPISTLMRPLDSVDLATLQAAPATVERSDVCAVAAAAVVGEAMVAFVLAGALLEKFGGDSIGELVERVRAGRAAQRAQITARGPGEPLAGPGA